MSTELLLKAANKDLVKLESRAAEEADAFGPVAAASDKLESLMEDVKDSLRPLERCLKTKKTSDGKPLTAEDRGSQSVGM